MIARSSKVAAWVSASTLVVLAGACAGKTSDDDASASDGGIVDGGSSDAISAGDAGTDAARLGVKPGEVPKHHYPGGGSCRTTRAPGDDIRDSGYAFLCDDPARDDCCIDDGDCTDAGVNARCTISRTGVRCTYDECSTSNDCAAGDGCACGDLTPALENACVPAKCRVDDDCGPGGFCSPSPLAADCGEPQYEGIYCHTPNDRCYDDSDCPQPDAGTVRCSFYEEGGYWTCEQEYCAG